MKITELYEEINIKLKFFKITGTIWNIKIKIMKITGTVWRDKYKNKNYENYWNCMKR